MLVLALLAVKGWPATTAAGVQLFVCACDTVLNELVIFPLGSVGWRGYCGSVKILTALCTVDVRSKHSQRLAL